MVAWFAIGFIGSIAFVVLAVVFSMLLTYSNAETEAYAGPIFGFGGYMFSTLVMPALCLIVERAKAYRSVPLAAITFAGSLIPAVLVFALFFVLAAVLN